jgi:hypothetical protein
MEEEIEQYLRLRNEPNSLKKGPTYSTKELHPCVDEFSSATEATHREELQLLEGNQGHRCQQAQCDHNPGQLNMSNGSSLLH